MFEPVNNSPPNTESYHFQNSLGRVDYAKVAQPSSNTETESLEESNRSGTYMPSRETPERLKKDLAGLHQTDIQYSIHEETGKTLIKIVDKENDEVIREIPSREELERSARLRSYIGQLFSAIA